MKTLYLDVELMKQICHPLTVELFDQQDNPITPFTAHNKALLDSALNQPRHRFDGKDLYSTLEDKAATLFYSLVKNHPFNNGNKRLGATSLIVFLYLNDQLLMVSNDELVKKTLQVAQSKPREHGKLLFSLKIWIRSNIRPKRNFNLFRTSK